jgi:hypothetical protein
VGIGLVFVAARIIYSIQYINEPRSRQFGAGLSFLTVFVLVLGGIWGAIKIGLTN